MDSTHKLNRRTLLNMVPGAALPFALGAQTQDKSSKAVPQRSSRKPNVLFIMTDQQRFDTIAALGNKDIYTPNLDRLVARGVTYTNAYSTCPVCVPARYTIRTGCEPHTTRIFQNGKAVLAEGQAPTMNGRCGAYLAETMRSIGYRTFGIGKFYTSPWMKSSGMTFTCAARSFIALQNKGVAMPLRAGLAPNTPSTTSSRT